MNFHPWAANFRRIVPDPCSDMHDCSVATGDYWVSRWAPKIITSGALANSAICITWDEGTTSIGGGGHVATVVVSPFTKTGQKSATWHNHYSLLRTIEDSWGLGCLNNSCGANDLRELLGVDRRPQCEGPRPRRPRPCS